MMVNCVGLMMEKWWGQAYHRISSQLSALPTRPVQSTANAFHPCLPKNKPTLSVSLIDIPSEDGLSRTWTHRRSSPWMRQAWGARGLGCWELRCEASSEKVMKWNKFPAGLLYRFCLHRWAQTCFLYHVHQKPSPPNKWDTVPAKPRLPPLRIFKVLFNKESILISRDQWVKGHATVTWLASTVNVRKSS